MKYNFHEHEKDELYVWALCHALGPLTKMQMEEADSFALDIELVVEGREINFLEFVDKLYDQIDHLAEGKAQQFVEDKLSGISNDLCTIGELTRDRVDAMWKEMGSHED